MATTGIARAAHMITIITVRLMDCLLLRSSSRDTGGANAQGASSPFVTARWPTGPPGERLRLRLSGTCRNRFHATERQERCHRAASPPILEPPRGRGVGWAKGESGGCAEVYRNEG